MPLIPNKYSILASNANCLLNKEAAWFLPALKSMAGIHALGTGMWALGDPDRSFLEAVPHYALSPSHALMNIGGWYGSNMAYRGLSGIGKGLMKVPGFKGVGNIMNLGEMGERVKRSAVLNKAYQNAGIQGKPGVLDFFRSPESLIKRNPLLTKQHFNAAEKSFGNEYQKQLSAIPGSTLGNLPIIRTLSGKRVSAIDAAAKKFGVKPMIPNTLGAAANIFGPVSIPSMMLYPALTGKQNPLDIMSRLYDEDLYSGVFNSAGKHPAYI